MVRNVRNVHLMITPGISSQYCEGCSVVWRDSLNTAEDIQYCGGNTIITLEGVQYFGGISSVLLRDTIQLCGEYSVQWRSTIYIIGWGVYHQYCGGYSVL